MMINDTKNSPTPAPPLEFVKHHLAMALVCLHYLY